MFYVFIANKLTDGMISIKDTETLDRIAQEFNNSLRFDASKLMMAYSIRDPVVNGRNLYNYCCFIFK